MRLEDFDIIAGASHAGATWITTLRTPDQATITATLTAVASSALVEVAVNRVYIREDGGGVYHVWASVADDFAGWFGMAKVNAALVLYARTDPPDDDDDAPSGDSWFYADQTAVQDLIGETALKLISNEPDAPSDSAVDTARLLRAGQWADAYMDGELDRMGYVTPIEVDGALLNAMASTHATRILMREANARMTAWKLNEPRMLLRMSFNPRTASSIDKVMTEHRSAADHTLRRISMRMLHIEADRLYARTAPAAVHIPSGTVYVNVDGVLTVA